MSILEVGAKCSLPGCEQVDFLPIRCRCNNVFCREHIVAEDHDCEARQKSGEEPTEFADKLKRCEVSGCSKPSLHGYTANNGGDSGRVQALCSRCQGAFCAAHRHPASHSCVASENPSFVLKNASAQALLAKHFPSAGSSITSSMTSAPRARKVPTDPKKLALLHKVELMKMRHRAMPADPEDKPASVLVDQRLHVKVSVDGTNAPEKMFWFRKSVSAGKALDLLASQMGVPLSSSPPNLMMDDITSGERVSLRYETCLSEQVSDGSSLVLIPPPSV